MNSMNKFMHSYGIQLLKDQHIVITGGAGSLAVPIIHAFINQGAKVSIADLYDKDEASERLDLNLQNAENVLYHKCDITVPSDVDSLVKTAYNTFGPINTACVHAGVVAVNPILQETPETFMNILNTNIMGSFMIAQRCAQNMKDNNTNNGLLLFTSSWNAENNWPGLTAYSCSKAAVNSLMKSFALELSQFGIRSNAIAPGMVDAGMAKEYYQIDEAYHDCVDTSIPLGTMQPLQSVVDMFVFLCSDACSYQTGSVVTIDGGAHLVNKHTVPIYYNKLLKKQEK